MSEVKAHDAQVAAPGRRPGQWGAARGLSDTEHALWLGDLNYRLSLPDSEARALLRKGDLKQLAKSDELTTMRNTGEVLPIEAASGLACSTACRLKIGEMPAMLRQLGLTPVRQPQADSRPVSSMALHGRVNQVVSSLSASEPHMYRIMTKGIHVQDGLLRTGGKGHCPSRPPSNLCAARRGTTATAAMTAPPAQRQPTPQSSTATG